MSAAHADEHRALMAASDAINAELARRGDPRSERTAHAVLAATIETRRELDRRDRARFATRSAPPRAGSREIPSWLLAVLLVLTAIAIATFAPDARAAPIDCQADQESFRTYDIGTALADCGYRYDWPGVPIAPPLPPMIDAPAAPALPVPEPAAWLQLGAGLAVICAAVARRRHSSRRNPQRNPQRNAGGQPT